MSYLSALVPAAALRRRPHVCSLFALALFASACATTGSTVGSGVGDRQLRNPPYYAGQQVSGGQLRIGHHPVAYQMGGSNSPMFDPSPGPGTPMTALLGEMNAYLDSLGVTTKLTVEADARATPPDVQFGCDTDASGDCIPRDLEVLGRDGQTMRIAVGRPSAAWIAANARSVQEAGVDAALVLTVEIGQYWIRQRGLRGDKEVELGTRHTANLPWLTSLETPVTVIQLTGALVRPDGTAIRIGAEGMHVRRTRLLVSAMGAQELIRSEDVERLRTARRPDLPSQPLVWKAAMHEMLAELTGRADLRPR